VFGQTKVAGAAEKRSGGTFLHQGSVSLSPFVGSDRTYRECFDALKEALGVSFKRYFDIEWMPVERGEALAYR